MSAYNSRPDFVEDLADLKRRVRRLETGRPIGIITSAPGTSALDGTLLGDKNNNFIYIRLNGSWKKVAVA